MARYTGPKTRIARKFGEAIFGPDKVLSKKNYPPGQHGNARQEEKLLSTESSFVRSKKLNTLTVYWKNSLETCLKRHHVQKVLPVKCCCSCWKAVWTT